MNEIRYYKGIHKVRVVMESSGYYTVEALEDFDEFVDGKRYEVKAGSRRIVPSNSVYKKKTLPPMVKEHTYELKMEKKLRRIVSKKDLEQTDKTAI
jgi:pyruvate-formate lyase-activating enzyme